MIGKPPGWRWACDIMRSDGSGLDIPTDGPFGGQQQLPPGFTYAPQNGFGMQQQQVQPDRELGWPGDAPLRGQQRLFEERRP